MQRTARSIISLFVMCYVSLSTTFPAYAQTQYSNPQQINPNVPNNLHNWTQTVLLETLSAVVCQIAGVDPTNPQALCLGHDPATGQIGFVKNNGGVAGFLQNSIASLYTPPLHTADYIQYLSSTFGIAKPTYAQGVGYQKLSPLLGVWGVFRNIVYLFFVIVFIIVGMAIMLRIKIDPRTVMSIENQIPKIIVALILVTFSFAISGLLIDFMWLSLYVVYGIFLQMPGVNVETLNPALMQGKNAFEAANALNLDAAGNGILGGGGVFGFATTITSSLLGTVMSFLGLGGIGAGFFEPSILNGIIHGISSFLGLLIGIWATSAGADATSSIPLVGSLIGALGGGGVGVAVALSLEAGLRWAIPNLIVFIIIYAALMFALFRLWIQLIQAYIFILLDVVLSPFWILAGLFPGSPIGFGPWVRDMLAYASAFPATLGLFLFGRVFIDTFVRNQTIWDNFRRNIPVVGTSAPPTDMFVPPLIGNPADVNNIASLIGFGIILLAPQVVTIMRDLFKSPQFKYTAAIGEAMRAGSTPVTGAVGFAKDMATRRYNLQTGEREGFLRTLARRTIAGGAQPNTWRDRLAGTMLGPGNRGEITGRREEVSPFNWRRLFGFRPRPPQPAPPQPQTARQPIEPTAQEAGRRQQQQEEEENLG